MTGFYASIHARQRGRLHREDNGRGMTLHETSYGYTGSRPTSFSLCRSDQTCSKILMKHLLRMEDRWRHDKASIIRCLLPALPNRDEYTTVSATK